MVICPKCGFDQPPDRYCASCGVDLENYKGKRNSTFRAAPFLFLGVAVLLTIGTVLFLDKLLNWDLGKFYPESEIIDTQTSSNFGAASDLQLEGKKADDDEEARMVAPSNLGSAQAPVPAKRAENTAPADFKGAQATFVIGEITDVEINQLLLLKETPSEPEGIVWGVADDIPLIQRMHGDRMKLNMGENKINYEDDLVRLDLNFEILNVTDAGIKAKLRYNRNLAIQAYPVEDHATFEITVPSQKTVYVVDRLPRATTTRNQIAATTSLLGLLYKSRAFLEETSEITLLLQFE